MSSSAQTIDTRIAQLEVELGLPTTQTAAKLCDEMDFQRAVQCYLWALPIVGVEQNRQGLMHDTGAKSGDLALYDIQYCVEDLSILPVPLKLRSYLA